MPGELAAIRLNKTLNSNERDATAEHDGNQNTSRHRDQRPWLRGDRLGRKPGGRREQKSGGRCTVAAIQCEGKRRLAESRAGRNRQSIEHCGNNQCVVIVQDEPPPKSISKNTSKKLSASVGSP